MGMSIWHTIRALLFLPAPDCGLSTDPSTGVNLLGSVMGLVHFRATGGDVRRFDGPWEWERACFLRSAVNEGNIQRILVCLPHPSQWGASLTDRWSYISYSVDPCTGEGRHPQSTWPLARSLC